nr:uncharacterized protein LOC129267205 [Lytechinus pictus]
MNSSTKTERNENGQWKATSTLIYTPSRYDHGKELICQVVQPSAAAVVSLQNDTMVLNILSVSDRLSLLFIDQNQTTSSTLRCLAKFKLIGDNSNSSITINNLNTDDSGNYTCTVLNQNGHNSSTLALEVLHPAPPRSIIIHDDLSLEGYQDNSYVTMTTGQPRDLTCTERGARPPALIEWRTDAECIKVMDQINVIEGEMYLSSRVATITPSKEDHNEIRR